MSLSVKPKLSSIVKYQLPEFINNESPLFAAFLKAYYKFMEQENQPYSHIRTVIDNLDVDKTTAALMRYIKRHVIPTGLENTTGVATIDDAFLIKFIREFYNTKGTEDSFQFIFDKLYNLSVNLEYGKDLILRPSDNESVFSNFVILSDEDDLTHNYDFSLLVGEIIYQPSTKAVASIQSVSLYDTIGGIRLFKCGIKTNYGNLIFDSSVGIKVDLTINNSPVTWNLKIHKIINGTTIKTPGSCYRIGSIINAVGGSGENVSMTISEVSYGAVEELILQKPGTGYLEGDIFPFINKYDGGEAIAKVGSVDAHGAKIRFVMEVSSVSLVSGNQNSGYFVGDTIKLNMLDRNNDYPTLTVASVGEYARRVHIEDGGYYKYARAMFSYGGSNYFSLNSKIVNNTITSIDVPVPALALTPNGDKNDVPTIQINGSGGTGTITVDGGGVITINVVTGGTNYVRPTIKEVKISGVVQDVRLPLFFINIDTQAQSYRIPPGTSSITHTGFHTLANSTTYDFDIVEEEAGFGFEGTVIRNNIATITYGNRGEFITTPDNMYSCDTFSVEDGTGAIYNVNFRIKSIEILAGGIYYSSPSYADVGGNFANTLVIGQTNGVIDSVTLGEVSNSTYKEVPDVVITDSSEYQGRVSSIILDNPGSNYQTLPRAKYFDHLLVGDLQSNNFDFSKLNGVTIETRQLVNLVPTPTKIKAKVLEVSENPVKVSGGKEWYRIKIDVTNRRLSNSHDIIVGELSNKVLEIEVCKKAKVIAFSRSIGKITGVTINDTGVDYDQVPLLMTPMSALVADSTGPAFVVGELVYDPTFSYPLDGNSKPIYQEGPHGTVKYYDAATNELILDKASDNFFLMTESGINIVKESGGDHLVHEMSYSFLGGSVRGFKSGANSTVIRNNRANMIATNGVHSGVVTSFVYDTGFLSHPKIRLQDGNRYQDFSYIIKIIDDSGYNTNYMDWKDVVKVMAHPAGYKMFGINYLETKFEEDLAVRLFKRYDKNGNELTESTLFKLVGGIYDVMSLQYLTPEKLEAYKFLSEVELSMNVFRYVTFEMFTSNDWGNKPIYKQAVVSSEPITIL